MRYTGFKDWLYNLWGGFVLVEQARNSAKSRSNFESPLKVAANAENESIMRVYTLHSSENA